MLAEHPGLVLITTGFYILKTGTPETDGPPGAVALGRALERLGRRVLYVTDDVLGDAHAGAHAPEQVLTFPVADGREPPARAGAPRPLPARAADLDRAVRPHRGRPLSQHARARRLRGDRADRFLFEGEIPSVGIGDGGNEIGMGNVAAAVAAAASW